MSRRLAAVFVAMSLLAPVAAAEAGGLVSAAPAHEAFGANAIESALPPGARQLLGALRVFKGLGARNRVYREAGSVQGDLRAYYDAQIETAQRQLAEREQLGLHESQVRAYVRVVEKLRAERDVALGITEDEKRAAKYGFESTLKRELTTALLQIPRVRAGLERAKGAIDDLKGAFEQARTALEGGNPITDLVGDLRDKLDRVDQFAELGSLINGRFGRSLGELSARVRGELDKIEQGVDEAIGAADTALAELDGVTDGIDESLASTRTVRADLATEQVVASTLERILTPRGPAPERDVLADALARNQLTAAQRAVGVAAGAIDPSEFRRMRDRVHAALLGRSLERIGEICGRIVGAARRLQLDAVAAGQAPSDTSTPCTLFGDPEALQAFIDAEAANEAAPASTTPDAEVAARFDATVTNFSTVNGIVVDTVTTNTVTIDLSGSTPLVAMSYEVRLAPDNYALDSDIVCQLDLVANVPLAELSDSSGAGGNWTGFVASEVGAFDGTCPAGTVANTLEGGGTLEVVIAATASMVRGTFSAEGDILTFEG